MKLHLRCLGAFFSVGLVFISAVPVPAQTASTSITGTVVAQESGLGISGAAVELYRGAVDAAATTTNDAGSFAFPNITPGEYSVTIRASGYSPERVDSIVVIGGAATAVRTPLRRAETAGSGRYAEIGRTNATSTANSLASTATIQYNLDPNQIQSQGFLKAGDALGQLPGVNIAGGPHTVGDDTSIDIRGMGQGEVRPLIDGHPIGPLGVYATDYYNYNNTPYALLDNIQVTYGSGASG